MTATTRMTRNVPVDTLRGFACILLVAYHVIGATPESGLKLHEGMLRDVNALLAYVRMPLFTFLSGLVYAWRPYTADWKQFIGGKIRRLIIPMLVVGTAFAVIQAGTPGTNNAIEDWRFLHLKPVGHFWFLESLFLVFLVLVPLEHFGVLNSRAGFFAVFLVACVADVARIGTPWLSILGAFYLFPFFLAGLYCTRFPLELKNPRTLGYLVLAIIVLVLIFFGSQFEESRRSPAALVIGMLSCLALYLTRPKLHWLAAIGFYSYSIYLFHVFFTAVSRIVLSKGGLTEIWLLFILGTLAGIAGPVVVEIIASRHNLSRILLLGKSPAGGQR